MTARYLGLAAFLVVCGLGVSAGAQEVSRPSRAEPPKPTPDINLLLNAPFTQIQPETFKRDDLREVPPAKRDKLSDSIRVTITIGDPRCAPGEDLLDGLTQTRNRTSRQRH
jgi:hypothetical protein